MAEVFWPAEIYLTPILLGALGHKGGNTTFARVHQLKRDKTAHCTTMLDTYGLGRGFPGSETAGDRSDRKSVV